MKIEAQLLRRRIYNALLFTPGKGEAKKSVSGGNVMVTLDNDITFTSTDGYVAVRSGLFPTTSSAARAVVSGEDLKLLENELRAQSGEIEITRQPEFIDTQGVYLNLVEWAPLWDKIDSFIDSDYLGDYASGNVFALDPRRLSKFSLLEPKGDYPVDFKHRESEIGQQLLVWKYGPDTRGVFSPLLREAVAEAYDRPEEVLW